MQVVSNTPLTPLSDVNDVALKILTQIGYLSHADITSDREGVIHGIPYRMFVDCFLKGRDRGWTAEELTSLLVTTKPTVYRHINKLKDLDLLDEVRVLSLGGISLGTRMDPEKIYSIVEAKAGLKGKEAKLFSKLLSDCFLTYPEKLWHPQEAAGRVGERVPVVKALLESLAAKGLVVRAMVGAEKGERKYAAFRLNPEERKGYALRYGNLAKAWNFVESNVEIAMENYRKSIEHLQELVESA